ncbi:hypothetical protein CTA2_11917, partial [Colletotrichum tanaceti]
MIVLVFIYTTAIAALYIYFEIFAKTDFETITPEQDAAIGYKLGVLNILAETAIQTTLWGNKCCLLILYNRLTLLGHYRKTWFIVAGFTGLAYLTVIVALYGGWCRPFSDYMELVPGNCKSLHRSGHLECLTWTNYNILQITMNLSTDLILLLIPVTLISKLRMRIRKYYAPLRFASVSVRKQSANDHGLARKILLICLFSM